MQNVELRISITDRTIEFAVRIVHMINSLPKTPAGFAISSQIVRSGTSIGANLQEARETYYWLTIISRAKLIPSEKLSLLLKENDEIIRILVTIVKKSRNNSELLTRNS